jgi:hypothetical protein
MVLNMMGSQAVAALLTLFTGLAAGCTVTVIPPQSVSNSASATPSFVASAQVSREPNAQPAVLTTTAPADSSLQASAVPVGWIASSQFAPGYYCYISDARPGDNTLPAVLELNIDADGSVKGLMAEGQVERPEDADMNTFSGVIEGNELLITIWNVFNHGTNPLVWQANPWQIDTGYLTYSGVICNEIAHRFMGP